MIHPELFQHMMVHLDLLDLAQRCSQSMLRAAQNGDVKNVNFLSENRERVIQAITKKQQEVESFTHLIEVKQLSPQIMGILKAWGHDLARWVQEVQAIDEEIVQALEREKSETSKQIGTIFKTKEQFKGYNLNSTKK